MSFSRTGSMMSTLAKRRATRSPYLRDTRQQVSPAIAHYTHLMVELTAEDDGAARVGLVAPKESIGRFDHFTIDPVARAFLSGEDTGR